MMAAQFRSSSAYIWLLLRFSAEDWEAAKRVKDRFLHEGNPDGIVPLNIPAEHFFTTKYRCGIAAGDRLRSKENFPLINGDWAVGHFPKDTVLEVLAGDKEHPEWIFVKVLSFPKGKKQKIMGFEIHEDDVSAGLFIHETKTA